MLLGCIADDLTGATDLALMLTAGGMRTVQVMDVPQAGADLAGYDAVVVALKSRTIAAEEAVRLSLASADALLAAGARQLFFKYCSTFDSTDEGNIGPVAAALLERVGDTLTLATPAFPRTGRTVYAAHLFVNGVPLAESPMKDHPLTPMRDSNLRRVLHRQTPIQIGDIGFAVVDQGAEAIAKAFEEARGRGDRIVVVDALTDRHLVEIGKAATAMKLITGGSGIALGLPANFARQGLLAPKPVPKAMTAARGRRLIIAGSCSEATQTQVLNATMHGIPAFRVMPFELAEGLVAVDKIVAWALAQPADGPVLVYSSADPDAVRAVQVKLGRAEAGVMIEAALAEVAASLIEAGFTQLIVAGGETSGAVVNRLGIAALEIGPEIDPGVPWTRSISGPSLAVALKSGNFGAPDFFLKAWKLLS